MNQDYKWRGGPESIETLRELPNQKLIDAHALYSLMGGFKEDREFADEQKAKVEQVMNERMSKVSEKTAGVERAAGAEHSHTTKRTAIVVNFNLPEDCDVIKIMGWIERAIAHHGYLDNENIWKGKFNQAQVFVTLPLKGEKL